MHQNDFNGSWEARNIKYEWSLLNFVFYSWNFIQNCGVVIQYSTSNRAISTRSMCHVLAQHNYNILHNYFMHNNKYCFQNTDIFNCSFYLILHINHNINQYIKRSGLKIALWATGGLCKLQMIRNCWLFACDAHNDIFCNKYKKYATYT